MTTEELSFQIHHSLVGQVRQQNNYRLKAVNPSRDYAVIYFSGNSVYYPNSEEAFRKQIVENDRYEWTNPLNQLHVAGLSIYVRDVYKQWYLKGISDRLSSIDDVTQELRSLAQGKKVITIGSSAGGFAAVLFGLKLQAEYIFCFSGQFDLPLAVDHEGGEQRNPLVVGLRSSESHSRYYRLAPLIAASQVPIFYFYGLNAREDVEQFATVCALRNVYPFPIRSGTHGIPFSPVNLTSLLNKPPEDLMSLSTRISHKPPSPFEFSIQVSGVGYLCVNTLRRGMRHLDLRRR